MSFEVDESFKDVLARLLRKGRSWARKRRRRRERKYSTSDENEEQTIKEKKKRKGKESIKRRGSGSAHAGNVTPRRKLTRRTSAENPKGIAHGGVNISREAATSVYINARVIRRDKAKAHRLLDFGQVSADQHQLANANLQHELPTAPPTTYTPHTQRDIAPGLPHRGSVGESSRVFVQMHADQQNVANAERQSELPMAPPTIFTPQAQRGATAGLTHRGSITLTHRGSIGETNRGSIGETYRVSAVDSNDPTESQSQRGSISQPHRALVTDKQFVDVGEGLTARPIIRRKSSTNSQLLKRKSSRSIVPGLGGLTRRSSQTGSTALSDALTPRTSRLVTTDADDTFFGHRGIEMRGGDGVAIDDIVIKRKDQARILEQTLQLLFSAEVLLFVEYMEVFLPLLYAACIGGLWHLPNAKYSVVLMNMSYNSMVLEVGTSMLYAMLELVSFTSVYFFIKKRYGISALYQLAFLLETYAMTLQGKLIGCFITLLNSSTLHQGIDITFKFDMDAILKTPNPYTT